MVAGCNWWHKKFFWWSYSELWIQEPTSSPITQPKDYVQITRTLLVRKRFFPIDNRWCFSLCIHAYKRSLPRLMSKFTLTKSVLHFLSIDSHYFLVCTEPQTFGKKCSLIFGLLSICLFHVQNFARYSRLWRQLPSGLAALCLITVFRCHGRKRGRTISWRDLGLEKLSQSLGELPRPEIWKSSADLLER